MKSILDRSIPYGAGIEACRKGYPLTANPYHVLFSPWKHGEWANGFQDEDKAWTTWSNHYDGIRA